MNGLLLAALLAAPTASHSVLSPDGLTEVQVELREGITWSVQRRGVTVLRPSRIGLTLDDGRRLGDRPRLAKSARRAVDERHTVPVPAKRRTVRDRFHELSLDLADGLGLVLRAYDDGVAYRL